MAPAPHPGAVSAWRGWYETPATLSRGLGSAPFLHRDSAVPARLLDTVRQLFATCAKARLSELIRGMQIAMKLL